MALVHAFALITVARACLAGTADGSGPIGLLTLTLSQLFFLLKTADVPFLRFRPGKRTWVAACLLVAWIHVDTIDPNLGHAVSGHATDLLATSVFVGSVTGVSQPIRAALKRGVFVIKAGAPILGLGRPIQIDEFRPRCWVLASHSFSLRGPPA